MSRHTWRGKKCGRMHIILFFHFYSRCCSTSVLEYHEVFLEFSFTRVLRKIESTNTIIHKKKHFVWTYTIIILPPPSPSPWQLFLVPFIHFLFFFLISLALLNNFFCGFSSHSILSCLIQSSLDTKLRRWARVIKREELKREVKWILLSF